MPNIVEYMRELSINQLFNTSTFSNVWTTWQSNIRSLISSPPVLNSVIDLGDHMRNVFRSTGGGGRGQSNLSAGGNVWEALVCWYLNLCLIGSNAVVIKQNRSIIPNPLRLAIQVNYGSFVSNTEADLLAIVFPTTSDFSEDINDLSITGQSGQTIPNLVRGRFNYGRVIDRLVELNFPNIELCIIQCKTNWNDIVQIPMLWDMVYASHGIPHRNITIGSTGYSITGLRRFAYAFVTVPTSRGPFAATSIKVQRVRNLSGGNYWGQTTSSGVAQSLKEIFTSNFASINIRTNLRRELSNLNTTHSYFQI